MRLASRTFVHLVTLEHAIRQRRRHFPNWVWRTICRSLVGRLTDNNSGIQKPWVLLR
jgi:hypothetical protein